jgi:hypothetical protein
MKKQTHTPPSKTPIENLILLQIPSREQYRAICTILEYSLTREWGRCSLEDGQDATATLDQCLGAVDTRFLEPRARTVGAR